MLTELWRSSGGTPARLASDSTGEGKGREGIGREEERRETLHHLVQEGDVASAGVVVVEPETDDELRHLDFDPACQTQRCEESDKPQPAAYVVRFTRPAFVAAYGAEWFLCCDACWQAGNTIAAELPFPVWEIVEVLR